MSTIVKSLPFRGDVTAAVGAGDTLAFVTAHTEGQPTALYRLDADKFNLQTTALPKGGSALTSIGSDYWVGGTDGFLYRCPTKGGPQALSEKLPHPPAALAPVAGDRLAVVAGPRLTVHGQKDGKVLQAFDLSDEGTCLSVDATGHWLVVGTAGGTVAVFEAETQDAFVPAEAAKLHDGRVTALSFEPDDLRFLSAGADNKLLSTYARGKLEPEDRGRGNNHTEPVAAIVRGAGRFYTGGRDSTVKAWPKGVGTRPVTLKDGVAKVATLAVVEIGRKPYLAVGCEDNSFRLFELDDDGKPGELSRRANDALALAKYELSQTEGSRREAGLKMLAGFGDAASFDLIADQMARDGDHSLRLLAVKLLGEANHPRVGPLLEKALSHNDDAVRTAAFQALRRVGGETALRPIELALKTKWTDTGLLAVAALGDLAGRDDLAMARLTESINATSFDVRKAALFTLEKVTEDASLVALNSTHADLRRLALVRLFQRELLGDSQVQAALRRREEDADAAVRQTAFLLSLFTRPKLAATLRKIDPELDRLLSDLEGIGPDGTPAAQPKAEPAKPAEPVAEVAGRMETIASKRKRVALDPADYEPLLQATASRSLDTCLRGARGLAVLGDPRAFGLLLQLSREDDAAARAQVCRAMAALDDPRAVNRLRSLLFDSDASVRDAAFTAVVQIHQSDPLLGAEAGLSAAAEDVRRRGLHSLVAALRANPPKRDDDPGVRLMERALNDAASEVRGEAFKAALNLKLGGGGPDTIRFALRSVQADVRREAFTEVMAQVNEGWAWPLVLEFFNDPAVKLRADAFEFATKRSKEVDVLHTALGSKYVDVRAKAVEGLIKKRTEPAQKLLMTAVADPEREVRGLALTALIDTDAQPSLVAALQAPHDDIRVRAAQALAKHGDPAALPVLRELATRPKPDQKERVADWASLVAQALVGMGDLGDEAALPDVLAAVESPEATVRFTAPLALVGLARPTILERLRPLLRHGDAHVKYTTALAAAVAGDVQAAPLVFAPEATMLTDAARLAAAYALGPAGEDRLIAFLDSTDDSLRQRALLLLMLQELTAGTGEPTRCLACLASKNPRARLTAARAVEAFADPSAFEAFVGGLFNDRGDTPAWKVPAEVVRDIANLLGGGGAQTRYRTIQLLGTLAEKEQTAFDQAWAAHARRFADEIASLRKSTPRPATRTTGATELRQLAFGAYVGLVREQGGGGSGSGVIRVRQTAMSRILELAKADTSYAEPARPVFVQALGDPNQPVRFQAFEHLQTLGMEATALGAEALASGHTDLGVKGLELVTDGTSKKEGDKALEEAMLTRTDALAVEAAKLLAARRGKVATAERGLTAAHEAMRRESVTWLAAEYDKDAAAQKALRQALTSRYDAVRRQAALHLGEKKDPQAFDALVRLLKEAPEAGIQATITVRALVELGDKRTPAALLDRIEDDPAETAPVNDLLTAAASFRQPETADRMLALGEKGVSWNPIYAAVHVVSGFDQPEYDGWGDENPDRKWERDQHPRHDAVLVKLLDRALRNGHTNQLKDRIDDARWSRSNAVDAVLAQLTNLSDAELRNRAVNALGWRLWKRNGSADPLLKALKHKDPDTQFYAAEGLAKAKHADGINVLLSAVEYLEDVGLRRRAVLALGELADKRAVDLLLRLANDSGHALQDAAAEAIGHLGKAADAGEVLKILTRYAKGPGSLAPAAVRGLRWLNTREGWDVVRQRALDRGYYFRADAVRALGHDDTPETRDALARTLSDYAATPQYEAFLAADASLRKLYGGTSLEPDLLMLRSGAPLRGTEVEEAVRRVCRSAPADRMLAILPLCHPDVQAELAVALQARTDLTADQLVGPLAGVDPRTVELAAHLLGGQATIPKGAAVATALTKWADAWIARRTEMVRANQARDDRLEQLTRTLESLLWTAGKAGATADVFTKVIDARPDDPLYRPVRLAALHALTAGAVPDAAVPLLERLAVGTDAAIRVAAAEALARANTKKAAAIAEKALSDRTEFNRLAARPAVPVGDVLKKAAGDQHYQGVALPHLIARKDFDALAAVATNAKLPEATRLGAVEGLAALAEERAEAKLLAIGQGEKEPEDVRKAAWKGLRRSRRARARAKN